MRLVVLAVLAAALAVPAKASAAPALKIKLERTAVRYGSAHTVKGTLTDGGAGLAAQEVVLEGRRYPYEGSFRFKVKLDRNHRLRVSAPAQLISSKYAQAYTLPDVELSYRGVAPGVVRLYQRYTVPKRVHLSAPTLFYLGSRKARRASLRRTGELERVRAGKYTSHVDVRLPASWNGAFRFASCFRASTGSGMGDPKQSCPQLKYRF